MRIRAGCLRILADACARMIRREILAQEQQGTLSPEWLTKHKDYCREVLLPGATLLAECFDAPPSAIDASVDWFLERHLTSREGTPDSKAGELESYLLAAAHKENGHAHA